MESSDLLLLFAGLMFVTAESSHHLLISPQSPLLEIGTNFTATCVIINTSEATADDLYWRLTDTLIPKEQYTRLNQSALSVSFLVSREKSEWLYCQSRNSSPYVFWNSGKFIHGIYLTKGYAPVRPENVSCEAVQEDLKVSPILRCWWESVGRQTADVPTTYTLNVVVTPSQTFNMSTRGNKAWVNLNLFPHHMILDVWVEAHNKLGTVESEHLIKDATWFVKTNPPGNVTVLSEKYFPTSLLITWTPPIVTVYLSLIYQIRFCVEGSESWTYEPLVDVSKDIQSFRLQKLQPDTVYVIQVRCKNAREDYGYWSDWSANSTRRTPTYKPAGKPNLWRIVTEANSTSERVQIVCKDPPRPNGRITSFSLRIKQMVDVRNQSAEWENVTINRSDSSSVTVLGHLQLSDRTSVRVHATAINSEGTSATAFLGLPSLAHELGGVDQLRAWTEGGQQWLEWTPPIQPGVSEYVVEWSGGGQLDWQRENKKTRRTYIKGDVQKFVCYNISVYPLFSGWTGRPARLQAYLEQGVPSEGPSLRLDGKPGRNEATLMWTEIPLHKQRGFITNYTVFYMSGTNVHSVTIPANTTSYTLKSLSADTKYETWVRVSTSRGFVDGFSHSFTTLKYTPGEVEMIVVGVSIGFLFAVLMTTLLCVYKRDVIKENLWPQIPDPAESSISNWAPEYTLKVETPGDSCLSGISGLDVEVCDGRSVFEEDKSVLPLKKDKYLSEEHSSGIGGSSCMSSPRQSVSDSDESNDVVDTTASTVQYSSVVASSGYKGQTPSVPQQVFSRSESTQPLLDSEDPDVVSQDGSRQSRCVAPQACFSPAAEDGDCCGPSHFNQQGVELQEEQEPLDFSPLEDSDHVPDPQAGSRPSYMPQRGGYRPQ